MFTRNGFSIFRIGLIGGIIGLVVIVVGITAFFTDQNSRRAPLNIDPPPGAQPWGAPRVIAPTARTVFFRIDNTDPTTVLPYYQQKMAEHYGGTGEQQCIRIPPVGEAPMSNDPLNPTLPYQFICMFDNSGMGSTQTTRVVIYPGVFNADPFFDATGATVIEYEQEWQP